MFEPVLNLFTDELAFRTAPQADQCIADQIQGWERVLVRVQQALRADEANRLKVEALGNMISALRRQDHTLFRCDHDPDRGFVVTGRLPLLTRDGDRIDNFISEHPFAMLGVIVAEAGSEILPLIREGRGSPDRYQEFSDVRIQTAAVSYLLTIREESLDQKITASTNIRFAPYKDAFDKELQQLRSANSEVAIQLTRLATEPETMRAAWQTELDDLVTGGRDRVAKLMVDWTEFMSNARKDIDAARAAAYESAALQGATEVWGEKRKSHNKAFWRGMIVLSLVIGGGLGALLLNWPEIIAAIPRKNDGDIAYGIVALIAVPIIAVGWLLRIGARLVTNALTLSEDAQQRTAMLETYLRLVGDQQAKMEPTDRILILNAIFRPLPGHQMEEVAPPTIGDLISDRLKSKN